MTADQKKHHLAPGHFTITRPWQLHKLGAPNIGPGRLHWLIVDVGGAASAPDLALARVDGVD
ncbi:MAG: hypothetical protein WDM76_05170 [Limisphaerales bacterium]